MPLTYVCSHRPPQEPAAPKTKKNKKTREQQEIEVGEEVLAAGISSGVASRQRKEQEAETRAAVVELLVQDSLKKEQQELGREGGDRKRKPTVKQLDIKLTAMRALAHAGIKVCSEKRLGKMHKTLLARV
jgi:hypothetical protein